MPGAFANKNVSSVARKDMAQNCAQPDPNGRSGSLLFAVPKEPFRVSPTAK